MDLKLARMQKGMNQRELADMIGVHPALVSQYEHKRRRPGIKTAKKIARILDFNWTDFYEDEYVKSDGIDEDKLAE